MRAMRARRVFFTLIAMLIGAGVAWALLPPSGPRSLKVFDPDRTAELETDMWRTYYAKDNVRLFRDLVTLLHEQNRYSWARAAQAGFYLARAAATFASIHEHYDAHVLPDLVTAYTVERDWLGASFDPSAVAHAELAWWVARRISGQNSPEQVGALIADENALLYGVPRDRVLAASILRARAGRLRDDAGEHADWIAVSDLLHQSYRALPDAVQ
jgi:hypothetical protein